MRTYIRKMYALYVGINDLLNQGKTVITPDELFRTVSTVYVTKILGREKKKTKLVNGGKARYTKSLIKIGETIGLLKQRDGLIEIKPMDEYTFNVLAGIFIGNIGREGGIAVWENKKMLEDVINYTKKTVIPIEEFTEALIKTGWVLERTPQSRLIVVLEKIIMELLEHELIEILDNGSIKIKIKKGEPT